jgi:hypothetical protein
MLSLLESKKEIADAQRKLEATIRRAFKSTMVRDIGHPGGTVHNANISTYHQYWYRSADHDGHNDANPRRLNWFGLFRERGNLQITVEINTPYESRNDQVAGFFGRDSDTGLVYLFHSGRVGGGMKGVGRTGFLAWKNLHPTKALDSSGDVRTGVLVMSIEGKGATRSLNRYIDTIDRFKQEVRQGIDPQELKHKEKAFREYYPEPRGRRTGKRSAEIDYISRHGEVVDALEIWRKKRPLDKGSRLVKNVLFDLAVERGAQLAEVYEIKTSAARQTVYTAIGQLMVHGTVRECRRAIVLPDRERLADDLRDALKRLKIEHLRFRLDDVKAIIA